MTVGELIAMLENFEEDTLVVLSKDAEGNGYSPITDEYSPGYYVPDTTWRGEFYSQDDVDEDEATREEVEESGEPCIVLWPTN